MINSSAPTKRAAKIAATPAQVAALSGIREHLRKCSVPPTYEELGKVLGISKSGARQTIHRLRRHGFLTCVPGRYRFVKLTRSGQIAAKAVEASR